MQATIVLAGLSGIVISLIICGYLFYEKNQVISIFLLLVGVILAIVFVVSEVLFKKKRHDAPWLFERRFYDFI